MNDQFFQKDHHVFSNKLGLSNDTNLREVEISESIYRLKEIQNDPDIIQGDFSPKHLKEIHTYLLQDIYDPENPTHMAGKFKEKSYDFEANRGDRNSFEKVLEDIRSGKEKSIPYDEVLRDLES